MAKDESSAGKSGSVVGKSAGAESGDEMERGIEGGDDGAGGESSGAAGDGEFRDNPRCVGREVRPEL